MLHLTRIFASLAALAGLMLGSAAMAQNATATATDWAKTKYEYAFYADEYHSKCAGLSKLHALAAREARKYYAQQLDNAGHNAVRTKWDNAQKANFRRASCQGIVRDETAKKMVESVVFLVDEYLLAIHYSGVKQCGVISAERMTKLLAHNTKVEAAMKNRPDFAFVEPVAREHGKVLAGRCGSEIIAGDHFLLMSDMMGNFLFKATDYMNQQTAARSQ